MPGFEVTPDSPKRLKVLVVDDQPDAADTVATLLSLMGYDARAAYSGREALQLFNELQPRVVLMDLGMPEMSGFEAAARIRLMPQGTSTTIVALTAWGDEMNRRLSREASIDYHVVKPAAAETLQEVLGRIRVH
jgi:CheY-like chemotaxis protein